MDKRHRPLVDMVEAGRVEEGMLAWYMGGVDRAEEGRAEEGRAGGDMRSRVRVDCHQRE